MKLPMQIFIALGLAIKRNAHIFFGIILGILFGVFMHQYMPQLMATQPAVGAVIYNALDLIGQIFLRLIQMVVIPLIFSAIIIGISSKRSRIEITPICIVVEIISRDKIHINSIIILLNQGR